MIDMVEGDEIVSLFFFSKKWNEMGHQLRGVAVVRIECLGDVEK